MGRRRRSRGRDVSGVIVLDKPKQMSSNEAVQQAKKLFFAQKVGHSGSLDPLATGVLPLVFGEATKFSQYLLNSDKKYHARLKLGVSTDSGDADGNVLHERAVVDISFHTVEKALEAFRGDIEQVPSMFSAIKHKGQPLYKLARQGIEIERKPRPVSVYSNVVVELSDNELTLDLHCSKGTYVRSIAHDLGEVLGCGAHVIELRRTMAGPFGEQDVVTFGALDKAHQEKRLDHMMQPVSSMVRQWPSVILSDNTASYIKQGQPVVVPHAPTSGWVQLCEEVYVKKVAREDAMVPSQRFIGVGEILEDGRVAPRRLVISG